MSWFSFTAQIANPVIDNGPLMAFATSELQAELSYAGTDLVITGAIDIFASESFTGPNRAAKVDRARLTPDPLEFASAFDGARTEIAALRNLEAGESPEAVPVLPINETQLVALAVANSEASPGAALDAINAMIAPDQTVPMPMAGGNQLAYARENAVIVDPNDLPSMQMASAEMECLATAIYFEARGESYRGQIAVAQVVMNRTKHRLYPGTICGVVFQNQHMRNACQFSFACDGIPERITEQRAWAQAEEIAKGVVDGALYIPDVGNATHYHANYVYPHWAPRMTRLARIDQHIFYQFRRGWQFG